MSVTVYQYPRCGTCRKALAWLRARNIAIRAVDIVEQPPSRAELVRVLSQTGAPARKLFNTTGQSYRDGGFKERVATMTDDDILDALVSDGKLIKRPLVLGDGFALIGFREPEWHEQLG